MSDYPLADTIYILFTTRQFSDGVPTVLSGTPVVAAYENDSATQITAGITLGVDHDSVVGLNLLTIVATGANGFESGKDYSMVITTGTVGGVSVVGEVVGHFSLARSAAVALLPTALVGGRMDSNVGAISGDVNAADNLEATYDGAGYVDDQAPATQSQLAGIANVGSAVHRPAASYVLTTGTQSANGVSDTEPLNGTRHEHTDDAGVLDLYYQFEIGGGTASSVQVTGYLTGSNDDLEISGYDWVADAWVRIGTFDGLNAATNRVFNFDLFVNMTGSGSNFGLVRIRFNDGAFTLTTSTLAVDQIFVSFSQAAGGYELGAVWIDTSLSNTNTVVGVDGISTNPVSTIGAANTLATALNLKRFHVASNSSITFAVAQENQEFLGLNWTLALGGQSISNSHITGADISGTGTAATEAHFDHCEMGDCTLGACHLDSCDIEGDITLSAAATYLILSCFHTAAASPIIDFGAAVGNTTVHIHNYHGAMTIKNMGQSGTDTLHFSSPDGKLTLDNTNTGGTKNLNGTFELDDSSSGQTTVKKGLVIDLLPLALVGGRMDSSVGAMAASVLTASAIAANAITAAKIATDAITAAKIAADAIGSSELAASAVNEIRDAIVDLQISDSVPADGTLPTIQQALYMTLQIASEFGIVGTTMTVRKVDGTTALMTFTLDDATSPTDRTRAT